ncbi:MAG: CCA tRNA nucleotidyltransferase [Synergistaceae bacterium]|nr:CCA tRNA nucleotidyltransferase [Synergistaceae bacterium]MBQ9628173.1 CCA tRNA nucleotidyltransferase [Synergistaceae bacterium]MBR0249592.1 CCA tRNA nucleotidyltransferase [Synergistaceae bacterium]
MNDAVMKVIRTLNEHGYDAFLVGGCVRNYLMNIKPADYDITTSAKAEDVKKLFDYRITGSVEKHGTFLVLIDGGDFQIEVTSYRDGALTLENDLSHRDFTVNAIACHPDEGLIDIYGGTEDIKNKIIRGVINSRERFQEDPLRILRALRFASVFGFRIEHETSVAVHELAQKLESVSPERIEKELTKIICGHYAWRILEEYSDVIFALIPELESTKKFSQHNKYHCLDVYSHTLKVLASSPDNPVMRWTALFHDIAKPECFFLDGNGNGHFYGHDLRGSEIASVIMERLRFDNRRKNIIEFLIKYHCVNFPENKKVMRRYLSKFGHDEYIMLLEFQKADLRGHVFNAEIMRAYDNAVELLHEVEAEDSCLSLKDLAVNGHDVMRLGLSGRDVGRALSLLLESVIEERVKNKHEELLEFLSQKIPLH